MKHPCCFRSALSFFFFIIIFPLTLNVIHQRRYFHFRTILYEQLEKKGREKRMVRYWISFVNSFAIIGQSQRHPFIQFQRLRDRPARCCHVAKHEEDKQQNIFFSVSAHRDVRNVRTRRNEMTGKRFKLFSQMLENPSSSVTFYSL